MSAAQLLRASVMSELREEIAAVLAEHVEPIFKPGMKLTLIARRPGKPTQTVIVSSDDLAAVVTAEVLAHTSTST